MLSESVCSPRPLSRTAETQNDGRSAVYRIDVMSCHMVLQPASERAGATPKLEKNHAVVVDAYFAVGFKIYPSTSS